MAALSDMKAGKAFMGKDGIFTPLLIYCAIQKVAEKWTAPLQNWALTISQLGVYLTKDSSWG